MRPGQNSGRKYKPGQNSGYLIIIINLLFRNLDFNMSWELDWSGCEWKVRILLFLCFWIWEMCCVCVFGVLFFEEKNWRVKETFVYCNEVFYSYICNNKFWPGVCFLSTRCCTCSPLLLQKKRKNNCEKRDWKTMRLNYIDISLEPISLIYYRSVCVIKPKSYKIRVGGRIIEESIN